MSFGIGGVLKRSSQLLDDPEFPGKRRAEDGFAVVIVLMIMIIMALLGLSLLTVAAYQYNDADRTKPSIRAFDIADSGLSYGKAYLARDNLVPPGTPPSGGYSSGTKTLAPGSYFSITIERISTYQYKITSTGTYEASERGAARNYSRTLEQTVEYRGADGHFDAFNYVMYSRDRDVTLDTGWLAMNSTKLQVDGNVYAGTNVNLRDVKALVGLGNLTVNGNVAAGQDANLVGRTGFIGNGSNSVSGNVTAGRDVNISAQTGVAAGSSWAVSGSVNAGRNVTMSSTVGALASATIQVATNAGASVNAKGNVTLNAGATFAAVASTYVGSGAQAASVNADGNVSINTDDTALAGSRSRVFGDVNARGNANMFSDTGLLAYPESKVDGHLWSNGGSSLWSKNIWLVAVGACKIAGDWRHGGVCSETGNNSWGSHTHSNPAVGNAPVVDVPDVTMPEPDWNWYRTMAIAQGPGHYLTGDTSLTNVSISDDPSSMFVLYCTGDLTIQNVIFNVQKKGIIVSEGDVTVTHSVQWQPNTEYQVIARGNITHSSWLTLNPNANDTVFLYTNGTHDHDGNPATPTGNVTYDLGWFRDLQGQITCTGDIKASVGGFARDCRISYKAPSVPVEAWPIPFKVLKFREL